jgi:hypothetical protein
MPFPTNTNSHEAPYTIRRLANRIDAIAQTAHFLTMRYSAFGNDTDVTDQKLSKTGRGAVTRIGA